MRSRRAATALAIAVLRGSRYGGGGRAEQRQLAGAAAHGGARGPARERRPSRRAGRPARRTGGPRRATRHRVGADPHVPRDPGAAAGSAVSRALRDRVGLRGADARARGRRLPRCDPQRGLGELASRHAAAQGQADRDQLRQRLRLAVHGGAPDPAIDGLGRRREPPADRAAARRRAASRAARSG